MTMLLVTGCADFVTVEGPATQPAPPASVRIEPRAVTHPGGQYVLHGAGTATSPYYWAWVPSGAAVISPPALPALPTVTITGPDARVATYDTGTYRLYGDGTTTSPYYWVWIPAGTTAPAPPPHPLIRIQ